MTQESDGKTLQPDNPTPESFKEKVMDRCRDTRTTRWWRFGIVTFIYLLWVWWMHNAWFLLGVPLLFDIYITGFVPFTWWKKSKNAAVRTVMGWVDAIVYALVIVYFVFNFVGQNYQIPSSSLEKTLLTGDYLFVNKVTYGPRVPMTPIHFPLVHNSIFGMKSYADWPYNEYRRLPGLRDVELGDIVVFNFPAGDTVATRFEESPEYYQTLVDNYGWERVNTDRETFGDIIFRPVDRRTNFVKRAVGLPGQRFKIVNDVIYLDGKAMTEPKYAQFRYLAAFARPLTDEEIDEFDINVNDIALINNPAYYQNALGALQGARQGDVLYDIPMTKEMVETFTQRGLLHGKAKLSELELLDPGKLFPYPVSQGWTLSNYGGNDGLLIPKKGLTINLNADNWPVYERAIRNYEGHTDSYVRDGKVYIDGRPADKYTFAMDYYFMMGDNRDMSQDSRYWGFVPEDHIVGTPMFVLISFDGDKSIFNGGIRWHRIFKDANPDK